MNLCNIQNIFHLHFDLVVQKCMNQLFKSFKIFASSRLTRETIRLPLKFYFMSPYILKKNTFFIKLFAGKQKGYRIETCNYIM